MNLNENVMKLKFKEKAIVFLITLVFGGILVNVAYFLGDDYDYRDIFIELNLGIILICLILIFLIIPLIIIAVELLFKTLCK